MRQPGYGAPIFPGAGTSEHLAATAAACRRALARFLQMDRVGK
jgi:hypothetical protein